MSTIVASDRCAAAPLTDTCRFYGRWDLRNLDRAITVNTGSYVLSRFSGHMVEARFDLADNKAPLPTITWQIDSGPWQEAEIAATVKLADSLPEGPHSLRLMVRGIEEHQSRWMMPLVGKVAFLGLDLPAGGQPLPTLPEWDHPRLTIEFFGDSITEGVLVQEARPGKATGPWRTDALHSYACQTALLLGAEWCQVGFGGTGLAHPGSGGEPGALDTFGNFYAGCPRDTWQPDVVVINEGQNDQGFPPTVYQWLYRAYLAMIRQAYPKAKIVAMRPFSGAQATAIQQEANAARAAGDNRVYYLDTTGWYTGNTGPTVHPNAAASVGIAAKLAEALKTTVLP